MGSAVGVDGCRFGWIAVTGGEEQDLHYGLFPSMGQLLETHEQSAHVLVDIPIGLPWKDCPRRPCDELARQVLGRRHVCVFSAPSREACLAATKEEARKRNREVLGMSLSEQALGICGKVAEVDALMVSNASARSRVREVHPEVCFWAMNDEQPMAHAKTTSAGVAARLEVVSRRLPGASALLERVLRERPRTQVKADDVLDALVAYLTALAGPSAWQALRGAPANDLQGLPMEMLYCV